MNENTCVLPDDMAEPCRTHGTVLCHQAPFEPFVVVSHTKLCETKMDGLGIGCTCDAEARAVGEAWDTILDECKPTHQRRHAGNSGGGTPRGYEPVRRAPVPVYRTLLHPAGLVTAAIVLGTTVFVFLVFAAWFGLIG